MPALEQEIGELLRARGLTLGAVESATGGLVSHLITNIPGSSDYFHGAIIAYDNVIKMRVVGVKESTLGRYGAVSAQVAEEMAAEGRKLLEVDICIADTGIAGPAGATPEKPVGLFYLGLASKDGVTSQRHLFSGNREENKRLTAAATLQWLRAYLLGSGG
ncbi:CinA family protein [Chloroflexota bacterium]